MIKVFHDKDMDTVIYAIEGDIEYFEIHDAIEKYYKGSLTKYTIGDYSKANPGKHLTVDELRLLSLQVTALGAARPHGFDLIVAPGILQYGVARIFKAYAEITGKSASNLSLRIFNKMEDALAFIHQNELPNKNI